LKRKSSKVEKQKFLNMLVCWLALPLTPLAALFFQLLRLLHPRLVSLFSFFLLFFGKAGGGDCSKTNCKLRTNWLTQPKAAIKRADADAKGSAPSL